MIDDVQPRSAAMPWKFTDFILLIVYSLVGAFVAGVALLAGGADLENPTTSDVAVTLVGQSAGALLYLGYLSLRRGTSDWGHDFGLRLWPFKWTALLIGIGLQIAIGFASVLFIPEDALEQGISDIVAETVGLGPRLLIAGLSVVVAPIVEELIFRSVLLQWLVSVMRRNVAIVVSALLFGAFHLLDANLYILPGLVIVGAILAWVTLRDGDLSRAIPIHMGFNLVGVVALFAGLG